MQSTYCKLRNFDDSPSTRYRPRNWALLSQSQMGSGFMIVAAIIFQRPLHTLYMFRIRDHEVVQALRADGADQAFGVWILPRTARGSENFFRAKRGDPQTTVVAVDAVPIPQQIATNFPVLEGPTSAARSRLQ